MPVAWHIRRRSGTVAVTIPVFVGLAGAVISRCTAKTLSAVLEDLGLCGRPLRSNLLAPHARISTFQGQQLIMRAALGNLAFVQNNNLVCPRDRAESMCDHEYCAAMR